jgi:hypothetical protein
VFEKTLFARGTAASATLERDLQPDLQSRLAGMKDAPAGMVYHLKFVARPPGRPVSSKVLRALIDIALSQRVAGLTQTTCREEVSLRFLAYGICKDWAKELLDFFMSLLDAG